MSKRLAEAYDESNAKYREEIEAYHISQGHSPIITLPDDEKAKWREMVKPVIDAWADGVEAQGLPGRAMLEDMETFAEEYK